MNAPSIFISYRWDDTAPLARNIHERLLRDVPGCTVFIDVASVSAGDKIPDAVEAALARSSILIALIGPRWTGDGVSRIHAAHDLVAHEVTTALASPMKFIPVLIDGTRMPAASDLPAGMADLPSIKAIDIRHARFDDDVVALLHSIPGYRPARKAGSSILAKVIGSVVGAIAGGVIALAALVIHHRFTDGRSAAETLGAGELILLVGALITFATGLGYWQAMRRRP